MNLTRLDLLVIAIPPAIVLSASIYLKRYMKGVADFFSR